MGGRPAGAICCRQPAWLAVALGLSLGAPGLPLRLWRWRVPSPTAANGNGQLDRQPSGLPTDSRPAAEKPGKWSQRIAAAALQPSPQAFGRSDFAQAGRAFCRRAMPLMPTTGCVSAPRSTRAFAGPARGQPDRKEQPQEAVNVLSQRAAWFRDAVRLRPNDTDARHNLELVLRRLQTLRDQLNKGQNTLEAQQLASLPTSGRCADRIRGLLCAHRLKPGPATPLAFHGRVPKTRRRFSARCCRRPGQCWIWPAMSAIACRSEPKKIANQKERAADPAAEPRALSEPVARNTRRHRSAAASAAGQAAHRQADVGVTQLKRAQEQVDPVTVLKGPGRRSAGHARPGAERVTGPESAT